MKALNIQGNKSLVLLSILIILTGFWGCSQESPVSMVGPQDSDIQANFAKKTVRTTNVVTEAVEEVSNYPQVVSEVAYYWDKKGIYTGLGMSTENGSSFDIQKGALTAPLGTETGQDVTITMKIEKDPVNNELLFTFEPHGCQFYPEAIIWLNYRDLGIETAKLFYIEEDGSYVEQKPESIDIYEKKMQIKVSHFSRYAIAFSR
jgi:hypothetical protein